MTVITLFFFLFFFNDTATTEIYTLSLHDALPISIVFLVLVLATVNGFLMLDLIYILTMGGPGNDTTDRKSTRLNSSHLVISYAVFCLKKKKKTGCLATLPAISPSVVYR